MEIENKELREKISATELNVGSFVQDMGSLLDQHELSACKEFCNFKCWEKSF